MISSKKTILQKLNFLLLLLIACSIINQEICRPFIMVFVVVNLVFFQELFFGKKKIQFIFLLAIPFLLELVFLWNNSSLELGIKQLEKRLVFLVFPILIVGQKYTLNLAKFLQTYALATTIIVYFFLIGFWIEKPEFVVKYLKGIHLWEMGYVIANYIGIHAPFLNFILVFVTAINFYYLVNHLLNKKWLASVLFGVFYGLSFGLILIINTRLALALVILCCLQLLFSIGIKQLGTFKTFSTSIVLLFLFASAVYFFNREFPYYQKKFTHNTFAHMEHLGDLDKIEIVNKGQFLVARLSMWQAAWFLGLEKPLFGHGSADGKNQLHQYYKKTNQNYLYQEKMPVHNQYLDFFLKNGFLGFLLFLCFLGFYMKIAWANSNPLAISLLLILLISCVTEDVLIRFWGVAFFSLMMSLFVSNLTNGNDKAQLIH